MRTTVTAESDVSPKCEGEAGAWRVTGGRPLFAIRDSPQPGWHLVTTDLTGESEDTALPADSPIALRFLPASGGVPLARRPIPVVGGRRRRVVHVPEGTERVRLEVSPWLDEVRVDHITFRPLPAAVAASMMSADVLASSAIGSTGGRALVEDLRSARRRGGMRASIEQLAIAYEQLQHRRSGDSVDYASWRIRHAVMFEDDEARLRDRLGEVPEPVPRFSVVMPVHDPPERWLRAALDSVTGQIYENWELCVVDDNSRAPHVRRVLEEYAAADVRIHVTYRSDTGNIAVATGDGVTAATGDFVAFMDHDDELASFALAVLALSSAEADVLYTDEDKIDEDGRHFDPHCKPPWNPELLLGQNYISHLTAIRRSLVERAGGLRAGFDGSQDHDLLLRVTCLTSPERIVHVPFVAYHWRAIRGSTAMAAGEKSYTEDASLAALDDRLGPAWRVASAAAPTTYRCTPPLTDFPLVSIVIPTRDRVDLLDRCVASLSRTTYPAFEVIVVDNDSEDPATLAWLDAFDNGHDHRVLRHPGAFNFSAVNNRAVESSRGRLVCLLNNDTEVIEPGWLDEMVRWVLQPGVGAVGAKLLYDDGSIQHAGVVLGLGGLAGHGHHLLHGDAHGYFSRLTIAHEVGAVTGACLLTRRSTWDELDGLDEDIPIAFNDIDYCLRLRHTAGQRIVWTPHALLYHHESLSRGAEDDAAKVARFTAEVDTVMTRWASVLGDDPAYSPNLSLDADSFTLARQPRLTPPWRAEESR